MKKQISGKQYVFIDLAIMALLMCVLEWACSTALKAFPRELYTISVVLPVALIAMMRHSAPGVLISAIGGLAYCIMNGAAMDVCLIYILGNSFIALNLLWFGKRGKERIRRSTGLVIIYVASGFILMNLGRSIVALVLGYEQFLAAMARFFATDALSAVIAVVIVLIANKQDGVFEDQMHYLKRLAIERERADGKEA